ncbi:MAG: hypothetical protein ABH873_04615 [Candidatus Firestonebacteria bacterium]
MKNVINSLIKLGLVIGLICMLSNPLFSAEADKKGNNQDEDFTTVILNGDKITEKEAQDLEKVLSEDINDLRTRAKLLGYYFRKRFNGSESVKKRYQEHILWLIQNKPESKLAGNQCFHLCNITDDQYDNGRKLWLKQIETNPNNPKILENASNYFFLSDRKLTEECLKKAQELEPNSAKWAKKLSCCYKSGSILETAEEKIESMKKSLEQLEKSYNLEKDNDKRKSMLNELAKIAFEAGDLKKAENYASDSLKQYSSPKYDWNYGNVVHDGNMILGRVALKSGDIDKAKKYLIESGKTSGSPQLDSFGPNMSLVKELLEKNEKEVVLQYFEMISKFWKTDKLTG